MPSLRYGDQASPIRRAILALLPALPEEALQPEPLTARGFSSLWVEVPEDARSLAVPLRGEAWACQCCRADLIRATCLLDDSLSVRVGHPR